MMSPLLLCCLSLACTPASSLPRLTITTHPAPLASVPATWVYAGLAAKKLALLKLLADAQAQ